RAITDEAGAVVDTRGYEAFGTMNVEAGSEALAYGFAGEPLDSTTHLALTGRGGWIRRWGGFRAKIPIRLAGWRSDLSRTIAMHMRTSIRWTALTRPDGRHGFKESSF